MKLEFITDGSMLGLPVVNNATLVPRIGEYLRVGTYKNIFSHEPDTTKLVVVSCVIYDYTKGVVSVYLEDKG